MNERPRDPQGPHPGLCATCRQAEQVPTSRGATFWRCGRAATDPRYARYPTLPVTACPGYERSEAADSEALPDR